MNKAKLNFIIDIFMFICMMLIASIGFLIKFTLIPGREAREIYGRNVDLFLFGMDRHQWGTLHLYIGFTLLGLLILHIYLHWKMIVALYRQLITSPKIRKRGCWIFMVVSIFLMVFPFLVNPKVVDREPGKGYYSRSKIYSVPKRRPPALWMAYRVLNGYLKKNLPMPGCSGARYMWPGMSRPRHLKSLRNGSR